MFGTIPVAGGYLYPLGISCAGPPLIWLRMRAGHSSAQYRGSAASQLRVCSLVCPCSRVSNATCHEACSPQ